jgi:hypothetical protein
MVQIAHMFCQVASRFFSAELPCATSFLVMQCPPPLSIFQLAATGSPAPSASAHDHNIMYQLYLSNLSAAHQSSPLHLYLTTIMYCSQESQPETWATSCAGTGRQRTLSTTIIVPKYLCSSAPASLTWPSAPQPLCTMVTVSVHAYHVKVVGLSSQSSTWFWLQENIALLRLYHTGVPFNCSSEFIFTKCKNT